MKTPFLVAIALMAFGFYAQSAVIIIDVKTTATGVAYSINSQPMTQGELAAWMKGGIESFGDKDPILIRPDEKTTFAAVFTVLQLLKASGVKHFEIFAESTRSHTVETGGSLIISAGQLKSEHVASETPPLN